MPAVLALVIVLALAAVTAPATMFAADPSPPGGQGGDPRSPGEGPGLVGDPVVAVGIVVVIALVTVAGTLLYVRVTGGRRQP
jgi:hypothetical protein